MRRIGVLFVIALTYVGALAACSDEDEGAAGKTCAAAPAAIEAPSGVPGDFPKPTGVVYTKAETAGPSTKVEGYAKAALADVYNSYVAALGTAPYGVTKKEKDAHDAEVTFAGSGTTGQVRLGEECKDRASVKLTVRPG